MHFDRAAVTIAALFPEAAMDTAVPTTDSKPITDSKPEAAPSPYTWQSTARPEGAPTQAMDGGPQVSQPAGEIDALPAEVESPRAATVRRVATGVVGLGLITAAALAARRLRGANAKAGANVIDYDD